MGNNLLAPRYKVIADWPLSELSETRIGQIFEITITDVATLDVVLPLYDKYPHLFRKLEWWEERKPEEMPEYAYDNENGGIGKVRRVLDRGLCIKQRDNLVPWIYCKPATEEEYLSQNKTA